VFRATFIDDYSMNVGIRDKHLKLDQRNIDKARRILGARTEQETVERALDMVLEEARIVDALRRAGGVGGFQDVFRGK